MSAYQPPYQYVIDSSALFDLKNQYPQQIFKGLWDSFNEMCRQQQIVAPREVLREIKRDKQVTASHESFERKLEADRSACHSNGFCTTNI